MLWRFGSRVFAWLTLSCRNSKGSASAFVDMSAVYIKGSFVSAFVEDLVEECARRSEGHQWRPTGLLNDHKASACAMRKVFLAPHIKAEPVCLNKATCAKVPDQTWSALQSSSTWLSPCRYQVHRLAAQRSTSAACVKGPA
jgi:hypothetical protein